MPQANFHSIIIYQTSFYELYFQRNVYPTKIVKVAPTKKVTLEITLSINITKKLRTIFFRRNKKSFSAIDVRVSRCNYRDVAETRIRGKSRIRRKQDRGWLLFRDCSNQAKCCCRCFLPS